MWEHLGTVVGATVIALLAYAATAARNWADDRRRARERSRPAHPVCDITRTDLEIYVRLDRALHRWGAQRAYLSKFHDGAAFIDGSDILKKSRTHERVRYGVSYQAESFRGMLVSTVAEEMKLVLDDGPSFTQVSDIPQSKFRWLCEVGGVGAVARCGVWKGEDLLGFVGLDFDGARPEKPADIEDLCRLASDIGGILAGYAKPAAKATK